jgi:hypothetical protein
MEFKPTLLAGLKLGFNLQQRLRFSLPEVKVEDATAMRTEVARVEAARADARIDDAAETEEARVEAKEERWL